MKNQYMVISQDYFEKLVRVVGWVCDYRGDQGEGKATMEAYEIIRKHLKGLFDELGIELAEEVLERGVVLYEDKGTNGEVV